MPRENHAVSICPGPNLAWFSKIYKLSAMVDHIYGRVDLLAGISRPSMFINELALYVAHYQKDMELNAMQMDDKKQKYLAKFRTQLLAGIEYYKALIPELVHETPSYREAIMCQLEAYEQELQEMETGKIPDHLFPRDTISA